MRHPSAHNLLSDRQYGFRKGRSTDDLLVFLTESCSSSFRDFDETFAVGLDISKAFDRVWHKSLISKLPYYWFYLSLRIFIASFLSDRSIATVVDGHCFSPKPINSGVSHGSVLSSLSIINQWSPKFDSMPYLLLCWWHHLAFFDVMQQTPDPTRIKWLKARYFRTPNLWSFTSF